MTVAVNTLANQIRRAVKDYPAKDTLFASMDTPDTAISVNNPVAGYKLGLVIVIDQEAMLITSDVTGTGAGATFSVTRAWLGTTVAQHAAGAPILLGTRFSPLDVLDAMNEGVRQLWPFFFKWVEDETITTTGSLQADYAIPAAFGESGLVTSMMVLMPGLANDGWRGFRWFRHLEGGSSRTISLRQIPPVGTVFRLVGIAPFTTDLAYGGTTDAKMIDSAVPAITLYARYYLKLIDEAERVNNATAKNVGPAAVAGGMNANLADAYFKQFLQYCIAHQQRYPRWQTRRAL